MARALLTAARRHDIEVLELTPAGTKRRFGFPANERFVAYDGELGPSAGVNLGDGLGELRFFIDDSVLVRARWDPITDSATGLRRPDAVGVASPDGDRPDAHHRPAGRGEAHVRQGGLPRR